jgi:hypothetical protein
MAKVMPRRVVVRKPKFQSLNATLQRERVACPSFNTIFCYFQLIMTFRSFKLESTLTAHKQDVI